MIVPKRFTICIRQRIIIERGVKPIRSGTSTITAVKIIPQVTHIRITRGVNTSFFFAFFAFTKTPLKQIKPATIKSVDAFTSLQIRSVTIEAIVNI